MEHCATYYSPDGTIKYLFDVPARDYFSGSKLEVSVESAFLRLPERREDKPEYSLCLSSQVGCVYSCLMCANAFHSFYRCLSPKELNEQIKLILSLDHNLEKILSKGSVEYAFMSVGEPLYGYNVIRAIQKHKPVVQDTRFSLSTVGAVGTIKKLTKSELPFPLRLEISLHFSNDKTRREWLLPKSLLDNFTPELTISRTLEEAEEYAQKHPGKIALNYTLIDGLNNTDQSLDELSALLKGKTCIFYVKLMYPNLTSSYVYSWKEEIEVLVDHPLKTYSPEDFQKKLLEAGIPATLFKSQGKDISAGCGMLAAHLAGRRGKFHHPLTIPQADYSKIGF